MSLNTFCNLGRAGVATHPWQGVWKGNVTVQLVSCNIPRPTIRYFKIYWFSINWFHNYWLQMELSNNGWAPKNERNGERKKLVKKHEVTKSTNGWWSLCKSLKSCFFWLLKLNYHSWWFLLQVDGSFGKNQYLVHLFIIARLLQKCIYSTKEWKESILNQTGGKQFH